MNILAIDTATEHISVCLYADGEYVVRSELGDVKSSSLILPMVADVIKELSWNALDAIAYGKGPGAFTGVRVGISVVQGLALAHAIPTIGFSSLEMLEYGAVEKYHTSKVISAIDARMGEVYVRYHDEEYVMRPEELAQLISSINGSTHNSSEYIGVGTGFRTYGNFVACGHIYPDTYPHARHLVMLALQSGAWNMQLATPQYLRNNVAKKSVKS